ncbi:MAG: hypothetical protein IKR23_06300, partial [Lachnospiraceae bacterium]|nr:hypothetical protein [Lachnospiraceae bacterium]
ILADVEEKGAAFGHSELFAGKSALVEFATASTSAIPWKCRRTATTDRISSTTPPLSLKFTAISI